jgi:hypothetical protein
MDSPEAKYTVDLCLAQSTEWPIYVSQRKEWVEEFVPEGRSWQKQIINDPDNHFKPYILKPGNGIVFSGSSQWHYRQRIAEIDKKHFCHLIFFHFIPKGSWSLIGYREWAKMFDIEDLNEVLVLGKSSTNQAE